MAEEAPVLAGPLVGTVAPLSLPLLSWLLMALPTAWRESRKLKTCVHLLCII